MKLARVRWNEETLWVAVEGEILYRIEGERFAASGRGPKLGPLAQATILPPIEPHNKVIGLLGNYGAKGERKGPGVFVKPNSAVIGQGQNMVWPRGVGSVGFEAELAVVVGKRAKYLSRDNALDHVLGYTIANDATSFAVAKEDGRGSTRFKSFDTFFPVGPWIVTGLDGDDLHLTSRLNGVTKQDASTSQMAFGVAEALAWVTSIMTLEPGDMISMGTPPGYTDMAPGDLIECEIEGIGVLANRLVEEQT